MQNARGGPVASKQRHDRRRHGGSPPLYGKYRPIKPARLSKSGKTTEAVARAQERKRNRIVPPIASLADTLNFIAGCNDPDLVGAYMAKAEATKEQIAARVAECRQIKTKSSAPMDPRRRRRIDAGWRPCKYPSCDGLVAPGISFCENDCYQYS